MWKAGSSDRVVKKNTCCLSSADVPALWNDAKKHLTQEEFCRTVGISRSSLWRYCREISSTKRIAVRAIKVDTKWQDAARELCKKFITYGYRRIRVLLNRMGHIVGVHRLRCWMRECGYAQNGLVRDTGRTPGEKPADPEKPNKAWQIDATKIYTKSDGWAWQTSILDVYDRRIVAYVVRKTCKAEDGMDVVARALDACFGTTKPDGLCLIHDRGSQFTSWGFKDMLTRAGIHDIVTAVRHPQSCGCLERFHRTLKEECIWLSEWDSLEQLDGGVAKYIEHYNNERIHSALGYIAPMEAYRLAKEGKSYLSKAA